MHCSGGASITTLLGTTPGSITRATPMAHCCSLGTCRHTLHAWSLSRTYERGTDVLQQAQLLEPL